MPRAAATSPAPGKRRGIAIVPHPAPPALVLTWSLSRPAAAARGLVTSAVGTAPSLEVSLPSSGPVNGRSLRAWLVDGAARRPVEAGGEGAWVRDSDLSHLDLPGVLAVSLHHGRCGISVLYARTGLLARLGLEGGRYEFDSGRLLPG